MTRSWLPALWAATIVAGVALFAAIPVGTHSTPAQGARPLSFLKAEQCYRFIFPITGAPNWKVLEVLEDGWIRAEVDAGPAAAKRESAWVNTAQIVTIREVRCSE